MRKTLSRRLGRWTLPGLIPLAIWSAGCVPPSSEDAAGTGDGAITMTGSQDGDDAQVRPDANSRMDDAGQPLRDSGMPAEDGAIAHHDGGALHDGATASPNGRDGSLSPETDGGAPARDGSPQPGLSDAALVHDMGTRPPRPDAALELDEGLEIDALAPDFGPPRPPGENLETEIRMTPPALSNEDTAVFTFGSNDGRARFECQIDGGEWTRCRSGQRFGPLRDGRHTFTVVAIDPDGVLDRVPPSYEWVIDTMPPSIRLDGLGQFGDLSGCRPDSGLTVRFSSNERDSRFRCESTLSYAGGLDEEVITEACTSPYERPYPCIDDRPVGVLVRVWAFDPAGNQSVRPAEAPGRVYRCPDCN